LRKDRYRVNLLLGIALDRRWPVDIRVASCRALGMIGDPATAVGIRRLMADPDANVQAAATKVHRRLERVPRTEDSS
jgi:HEAT repeat protein